MIFENELTDQEMDEIFENGFDAYIDGFSLDDNPFVNSIRLLLRFGKMVG